MYSNTQADVAQTDIMRLACKQGIYAMIRHASNSLGPSRLLCECNLSRPCRKYCFERSFDILFRGIVIFGEVEFQEILR